MNATITAAYRTLIEGLPDMSDKDIIVGLAALVALLDDDHTRLSIPREHPQIGLEIGHTATPEPEHAALRFKQLPLAFEQFEDGVYVVAANAGYQRLIGHRVAAVDGTPIAEAMQWNAAFVGEPTGSRPDHFGNPIKVRLKHSGLTLRVSRLHWSSYTAFDEREGLKSAQASLASR